MLFVGAQPDRTQRTRVHPVYVLLHLTCLYQELMSLQGPLHDTIGMCLEQRIDEGRDIHGGHGVKVGAPSASDSSTVHNT